MLLLLVNHKNGLIYISMLFVLLYFGFWWTYRLDTLPGLHADEAWSGLKAIHFENREGIDQLTGMNYYTGILQAIISEFTFRNFGIGVFQLRIGGAILNLLSLILICGTLIKEVTYKAMLTFVMFIGQSALYLISPRVAWEVNSLTLFFLSVLLVSFIKIKRNIGKNSFWCFIFLCTNILGTYNHVIFSCISVSAFLALLLWTAYNRSIIYKDFIILLTINLFNLIIVYLSMRHLMEPALKVFPYVLSFIFFILIAEGMLYRKLIHLKSRRDTIPNFSSTFIKVILILAIISFLAFHGMAFLQTVSNYKIILQSYSREYPLVIQVLFFISGAIYIYYLAICLWRGLGDSSNSIFAYMLIIYMGVFNLYTIETSFRYYLAFYACASLYIAHSICTYHLSTKKLIIGLASGFILLNGVMLDIFFFHTIPLRAVEFNIGNGKIETSAHFLPKQPLINFLQENEIGQIRYLEKDFYFIEEPIKFYKHIHPWIEKHPNKAIIDFDFNGYGTGFLLYRDR